MDTKQQEIEICRLELGDHTDHTWARMTGEWQKQCHKYGEDFSYYIDATMSVLEKECESCLGNTDTGVFAIKFEDNNYAAIFWGNLTRQAGYEGKVFRVRDLILSPKFDFGEYNDEQYAKLLSHILSQIFYYSCDKLPSKHIKIHFRSRGDIAILKNYVKYLEEQKVFQGVRCRGAWIDIEKKSVNGYTDLSVSK